MFHSIKLKPLLTSLALPLAAGGVSALLAGDIRQVYDGLLQPPLSPPGPVFPVVWTVLYLMMGLALYRVRRTDHPEQQTGIRLFAAQLAVNAAWTPLFFRLQWFGFALLWLLMLLWLAARTPLTFGRIDKTAGLLLAPCLLWLTFAAYLNWGVSLLN